MQARLSTVLASAAVLISAVGAPAQTTMAPTAAPVVGPPAAPSSPPATGGGTSTSTRSTSVPMPAPTGPAGMRTMPLPAGGPLALDARYLRGTRTASGYRLTGQAQVKDACTAARFSQFLGDIFPPQFNLVQYRRPGTLGLLCAQHLTWVTAEPQNLTSAAPPRYVSVRTQKGIMRVPILPGPQ
jgi:hypothetical protein